MKHTTTVLKTRRTAAKHVHRTSPDPLPAFVSRISDKFCSCNHCLSEIFTKIRDLKKLSCQHLQNLEKPTQTQTQMFAAAADFSELLVATTEIECSAPERLASASLARVAFVLLVVLPLISFATAHAVAALVRNLWSVLFELVRPRLVLRRRPHDAYYMRVSQAYSCRAGERSSSTRILARCRWPNVLLMLARKEHAANAFPAALFALREFNVALRRNAKARVRGHEFIDVIDWLFWPRKVTSERAPAAEPSFITAMVRNIISWFSPAQTHAATSDDDPSNSSSQECAAPQTMQATARKKSSSAK